MFAGQTDVFVFSLGKAKSCGLVVATLAEFFTDAAGICVRMVYCRRLGARGLLGGEVRVEDVREYADIDWISHPITSEFMF